MTESPLHLIKSLILLAQNEAPLKCPDLDLVFYKRWNDQRDYRELPVRARVRIPRTMLYSENFPKDVRALAEAKLSEMPGFDEWGFDTKMGDFFLPAVDLAPGFGSMNDQDLVDVGTRLARIYSELPWTRNRPSSTKVSYYTTGNGFHAYLHDLVPARFHSQWLGNIAKVPGIDDKWVANAHKATNGILRLSAGLKGRIAPTRLVFGE